MTNLRATVAILELVAPPASARVLAALLDGNGEAGSQAALAERLNMGEGKVSEAVRWLKARGLVRIEAQRGDAAGTAPNRVSIPPSGYRKLERLLRPYAESLGHLVALLALEGA